MAANIPRFLPFADWDEWIAVKNGLFSTEPRQISVALEIVSLWRVRGRLPLSIDSTAQLVELRLRDSPSENSSRVYHSENELKLLYSAVVVRSVNGLVDPSQQGVYATSVLTLAERMGLPGWIVELRHDATHNQMPSLSVLRTAASTLINWYFDFYWQPQMTLLQSLTSSSLPVLPVINANITSKTKQSASNVPAEVVESTQPQDSSPTFVAEIFMPVFLGIVVQSAPSVIPATLDISNVASLSGLVAEETSRQRKFWSSRVQDMLRYNNYAYHALLCGLVGAAKDTLAQSQRHDIETWRAEWALEVILFWVAEITTLNMSGGSVANSNGASSSGKAGSTVIGAGANGASLNHGFLQTLLGLLQDSLSGLSSKKGLCTKAEELVRVVSALASIDLRATISDNVPPNNLPRSEKKRKLSTEADGPAEATSVRQSLAGDKTSTITRLYNLPMWPLGCMPGSSSTGHLYNIEEM